MALIYHAYNRGRSIISRSKVHNAKFIWGKMYQKMWPGKLLKLNLRLFH